MSQINWLRDWQARDVVCAACGKTVRALVGDGTAPHYHMQPHDCTLCGAEKHNGFSCLNTKARGQATCVPHGAKRDDSPSGAAKRASNRAASARRNEQRDRQAYEAAYANLDADGRRRKLARWFANGGAEAFERFAAGET